MAVMMVLDLANAYIANFMIEPSKPYSGQARVITGDLSFDQAVFFLEQEWGVRLHRRSAHMIRDNWTYTVVDEKKFTLFLLKYS